MTTATQETGLALTKDQQTILEQKRTAWSEMGATVYKSELIFQARAQQILAKIKIPTKVEEISSSEKTLKEVKAEFAQLQADRKSITSKFDAVADRLMAPEKSGVDPIKQLETAIIGIKKLKEQQDAIEREKTKAYADCREFLLNTKNEAEASFKKKIMEKVEKCYTHALGAGNILPEEIDMFIDLCKDGLKEEHFKIQYPLNQFSKHVSTDDFAKMCAEILIIDSKPFVAQYQNELTHKFVDYKVAFNNKEEAIAASQKEAAEKAKAIEAEKANANAAAQLSALGTVHEAVLTTETKALKKSYEVYMPENLENSVVIMSAFVANIALTASKLKVNKWDSFTIGQMKNALGKCKSDDNAFAPQGIFFKQVDKL